MCQGFPSIARHICSTALRHKTQRPSCSHGHLHRIAGRGEIGQDTVHCLGYHLLVLGIGLWARNKTGDEVILINLVWTSCYVSHIVPRAQHKGVFIKACPYFYRIQTWIKWMVCITWKNIPKLATSSCNLRVIAVKVSKLELSQRFVWK